MWNKKYAPALAILLAAGLTAGSLPVDVAAANAEQTENVGAQEENAKSTIEEGAGATGDSSKDKEESKSEDGGDTKAAETSKEDGKGSDKDAGTNQGDNSDAGTGTGKTESKETGTGDAGTGEAGAGESDENGSDNTTIVPPQEGGGEGAPVEESEEPFLVSINKEEDDTLYEGDRVKVTITLNQNIRYCQTFQYHLYIDDSKLEYVAGSLDCNNFGRSIVITDLQTDENDNSRKYYSFSPDELGGILDSSKGSSFTIDLEVKEDDLTNVGQYISGELCEDFRKGKPYRLSLDADPRKAVGDEIQVKTKIGLASNSTGRKQYSAYYMQFVYDVDKLSPLLSELDSTCAVDTSESGKLTISWSGDLKNVGEAFTLKFRALKSGIANVQLLSARVDDQNKLEDGTYAGIDPEAPDAEVPEKKTSIKIGYNVTLPENYAGAKITNPENDYTFNAKNLDTTHYIYTVTAKVGEAEVSVTDNKNGSYTISKDAITGDLVITSTAIPVQYDVTVNGGGKDDVIADKKATYSEDYTFKVKEDSDYTYTVTAKVEDKDVTLSKGEKEENGTVTYTIAAGEVTGNININVDKQVKTTAITFDGTGRDDVNGLTGEDETTKYIKTVPNNADFVFSVDEKEGYLYTVKIGDEVLEGENGTYKIVKDCLTGTGITVMVDKAQKVDLNITVAPYMKVNEQQIFLLTVKGAKDLPEGQGLAYETTPMYWSEKYEAYAWLITSDQGEDTIKEEAKNKITQMELTETKPEITYKGDVNDTGVTDVNDAQYVYGIYNQKFSMDLSKPGDMQKLLRADVSGDGKIDVADAATVINLIMNPDGSDVGTDGE